MGVFVTNNLLCLQRADLATNDIELLWLELHTNSKTVLVGVCYRPPGQSTDEQSNFFSKLETSIENVKIACPDNIVLLGDFNDKCTDWHMPHTQSEVGNKLLKSRKENPQKPTQLSSRSHPRHLVGKRTAQKTPS